MPPKKTLTTVASTSNRPYRAVTTEYVQALAAYAELLFKGGLGGSKDCKRPEDVAAKIEVGRDVGLPATMAIAYVMIVRGKPTIWGDAALALIRASGKLAEGYPKESYEGVEGTDSYTAVFKIKRATGGTPEREVRFSLADARVAKLLEKSGPWQEYPSRQLMWRARSWGCRDEFQDVLCGLTFTEEALDWPEETGRVEVLKPIVDVSFLPPVLPAKKEEIKEEPKLDGNGLTSEQLDRICELRDSMMTARGLKEEEEIQGAWVDFLEPFGVKTIRDLSRPKILELIAKLERENDPFTSPKPTS